MHPHAAQPTRSESCVHALSRGEYDRLVENMSHVIERLVTLNLHYEAYQVQTIRDRIMERQAG
jgi:hypothetical protein